MYNRDTFKFVIQCDQRLSITSKQVCTPWPLTYMAWLCHWLEGSCFPGWVGGSTALVPLTSTNCWCQWEGLAAAAEHLPHPHSVKPVFFPLSSAFVTWKNSVFFFFLFYFHPEELPTAGVLFQQVQFKKKKKKIHLVGVKLKQEQRLNMFPSE